MIVEIVLAALSLGAAGLSYKWQRDTKRYQELSRDNEHTTFKTRALALNDAEESIKNAAACRSLLVETHKTLEETKQIRNNCNILGSYTLKSAKDYAIDAASHASVAKTHADTSDEFAEQASRHRDEAQVLATLAQTHAMTAAEHCATSGTLSVAVTKAAQSAASKTQKQAQCWSCERPVNSYKLLEDGRIICKWCHDRGRHNLVN